MLSVKPLAAGSHGYYVSLVSVNYYTDSKEPPGIWHGKGALEFGLEPGAVVEREHLERLCEGFDPHDPKKKLVWNAGRTDGHAPRSPGLDVTLSVSKSLSIFWALSDEEIQRRVEKIVLTSAKQTLGYLEDYCGVARVGKFGLSHEEVPLLFAMFPQSSSRLNDMQLHIHCLLINATRHADGRTTAIDPTTVFDHQFSAGSIFNVAVAENLRRELGLEVVLKQTGSFVNFELKGISDEAIEHYSKRKTEIDDLIKEQGESRQSASAAMRQVACLETCKGKDERPRSELIRRWKAEAAERFGITPEYLETLHGRVKELSREEKAELREVAFRKGVAALEEQHSHWSLADLHQKVSEAAQGCGLGVADVREVIANKLESPELEILGEARTKKRTIDRDPEKDWKPRHYLDRYQQRITSPAVRQAERALLGAAERIAGTRSESPSGLVERAIKNNDPREG